MIGIDYELFWTLNPRSLSPFVKAFELKQEYDDMTAWRHGLYVQMAISACLNKESKYPKKALLDKSVKKEHTMTGDEIKDKMMRIAPLINARFGKED